MGGCFRWKVVSYGRLSHIEGGLILEVVPYERLSYGSVSYAYIKEVVLYGRFSHTGGGLK